MRLRDASARALVLSEREIIDPDQILINLGGLSFCFLTLGRFIFCLLEDIF